MYITDIHLVIIHITDMYVSDLIPLMNAWFTMKMCQLDVSCWALQSRIQVIRLERRCSMSTAQFSRTASLSFHAVHRAVRRGKHNPLRGV